MKSVLPIKDIEKLEQVKSALLQRSKRDYIMFLFGIYTGLRISDILKLKVSDVRDKAHILLLEQKTGKRKQTLIVPELKREINIYIKDMPDGQYLFKSREGMNRPISRKTAYYILNEVAKKCGLSAIGCHSMRKTFGYFFYDKCKKVSLLMEIFNHSSEAITLRYIGVSQDAIDKEMKNFKIGF